MNRTLSVFGLAVAAVALVSVVGCHRSSPATTPQAAAVAGTARVTAAPPVRKTLRRECVQPGWIEAFESTPLLGKLPSYVQELYVDIGDRVKADQLLVDLSLPELKDELGQKEAACAQAQAEIELAAAAARAAEAAVATAQANIKLMDAGMIRAEADVTRWKSQYVRISGLVAGGSLDRKLQEETDDSLKSAEASLGEARAKVEAAKAALVQSQADLAKANASQSAARAHHRNANADMARIKTLLQYTQIRAPYAGVVTERNINRGDFVQPAGTMAAKPLLTVARTDTVRVFVDVPEMDSPWVEAGRNGYVEVQALADRIVEGKVTRTSWALGANRTLRTELDIPNPSGALRPGMYAIAHIVLQEHPNVCVLPLSAIVREGKQAFCWVAKGGKAMRTPVVVGLQVGNEVEVTSGLTGDELVIQSQVGSLHEGQSITVSQ